MCCKNFYNSIIIIIYLKNFVYKLLYFFVKVFSYLWFISLTTLIFDLIWNRANQIVAWFINFFQLFCFSSSIFVLFLYIYLYTNLFIIFLIYNLLIVSQKWKSMILKEAKRFHKKFLVRKRKPLISSQDYRKKIITILVLVLYNLFVSNL